MYSFNTIIRYTECGCDRKLTIPALIDLFQDCSTFHSGAVGLGLDFFDEERTAWFLLNWQIVIERMPSFNDTVKVCTAAYDFKGFYGNRNFWLEDEQGDIIVKAASLWAYMNIDTGKPVRADEKLMERYGIGKRLDMEYAPRKIAVPDGLKKGIDIEVRPDMIDTNNHVNNGQYVRIALGLFAADGVRGQINQVLAEYKKSAVMGDIFHTYSGQVDNRYYVCLKDDEDNVNAIVVFEMRDEND